MSNSTARRTSSVLLFLWQGSTEVKRLIEAMNGVYICDGCVLLGAEIMAEEGR
jgi:hypothetical protein